MFYIIVIVLISIEYVSLMIIFVLINTQGEISLQRCRGKSTMIFRSICTMLYDLRTRCCINSKGPKLAEVKNAGTRCQDVVIFKCADHSD